MIERKAMPN